MTDGRIVHAIDCDLDDDCTCGAVDACETCGKTVPPVPGGTHLCGQCAEDWQTPEGRKRIDRRRKANGLPPLDNPETAPEGAER